MTSPILLLAASNDSGVYIRPDPSAGLRWLLVPLIAAIIVGAITALQRWVFARRDRGEEASTSRGEGAEAIIFWNNPHM